MSSWSEFLSRLLESSHKVEKAAVFNVKGQPLATTENLQISNQDGLALLHCLLDPAHNLTRLTIDDTSYRCYQGNDTAVIGMATNDPGRVLVARLTDDALILVMGSSQGHGSFLFELQQNIIAEHNRRLVPQGQSRKGQPDSQVQQQVLPPPPPTSKSALSHDQVLIRLQDGL